MSKTVDVFEEIVDKVIFIEGCYSNDPSDSGGRTCWGITKAVARANGYRGSMDKMPKSEAKRIYRVQFWDLLRLDSVASLSVPIAEELFDTSVNCGQGVSAKFLQVSLNVLNRQERDYRDIREDGIVGPMTVVALQMYLRKRGTEGEKVLLRILNSLQGARYVEIAKGRKKDEKFTYGWFLQRVKIE